MHSRYNLFLLVAGVLWLAILLRARENAGSLDVASLSAFWRTFFVALCQAFFIQDPIKVLLISFVSPPFWSTCLKPGSQRAIVLRACLRAVSGALMSIL